MKISAIVPTYNEEKTLEKVIRDLSAISFLSEIIVINDGSTDTTKVILDSYTNKVTVLHNNKNEGKGFSVAKGLERAVGDIVLFLDADIINYTARDLRSLIDPVSGNDCDYTMRMTDDPSTKWTSGVRAYRKVEVALFIENMKGTTRYGLETLLNKKLSTKAGKFIVLRDAKHFQKFEKYSFPRALWEYLKEGISIGAQMVKNNL